MEDNEIVALFWQRDQRAITVALEKYGKLCENLASGILGNGQDAEECVSDAYMAAWNAIPPCLLYTSALEDALPALGV